MRTPSPVPAHAVGVCHRSHLPTEGRDPSARDVALQAPRLGDRAKSRTGSAVARGGACGHRSLPLFSPLPSPAARESERQRREKEREAIAARVPTSPQPASRPSLPPSPPQCGAAGAAQTGSGRVGARSAQDDAESVASDRWRCKAEEPPPLPE